MKKWVELVYLRYHIADVKPSVFLMLFFRMIGIYIYEVPGDVSKHIKPLNECFAEIFLLSKNSILKNEEESEPISNSSKLFIRLDETKQDALDIQNLEPYQIIEYRQNDLELLLQIIDSFKQIYQKHNAASTTTADISLFDELSALGRLYSEHQMMETLLTSKFFFAHGKLFDQASDQFIEYIDAVLSDMSGWDDEALHHKYTVINMAYELNTICQKNQEAYIYDINQLAELSAELDMGMPDNFNVWMLKAQIYDDLLKESQLPMQLYQNCLNKVGHVLSYAEYRLGMIYEKNDKNYQEAIRHYQKALNISPSYYRVLYRMANCYQEMGNLKEAIDSFSYIDNIMREKMKFCIMRPMEIEYYYKISYRLGNMYIDLKNDFSSALFWYKRAEQAWNMIDNSVFLLEVLGLEKAAFLNSIMKNKYSIKTLYDKIYMAYRIEGQPQQADEYRNRFNIFYENTKENGGL